MRLRLAETDASGQLATLQVDVAKPTMRYPIQASPACGFCAALDDWHASAFLSRPCHWTAAHETELMQLHPLIRIPAVCFARP